MDRLRLTEQKRRLLKRQHDMEPIIGHLKADHRMNRCHLKGQTGDAMHAVLCAVCCNIRWLLRMIRKKGISFFSRSSRHWDYRNTSKLFTHRQPPNRFQPFEINPTEYSLDLNESFPGRLIKKPTKDMCGVNRRTDLNVTITTH
jgi:hypothetical protein